MSSPAVPASSSDPCSSYAITTADAEPDVMWGDGGIDDWGWKSGEPTLDEAVDQDRGRV
jgi:hypothetical protein